MKKILYLILFSSLLALPNYARADYYFNPHFVITDEEMTDYLSLSLAQIQRFLEDKGSYLAEWSAPDYNGVTRPAAEIIWQAAQESQISPKVLLTTLQKEQSLIGDKSPSQNQLDKAMGYRCPDGGSCNVKSLGFGKQVDGAAWQFRQYYNTPNTWTYRIGETYIIDGYWTMPVNQATASLYNYTPHYSGNKRFWELWQKYWGKNYPDGTLLKADDNPGVWLIQYGTRRLIKSWGVLLSRFDPRKIITVNKTDLEKYAVGPDIKFHNYSLLRVDKNDIYLLVNDELRQIVSLDIFRNIGFNPEEIEDVASADLAGYQYGADITAQTAYPTGALLQDQNTGGVYFVENGVKYPIYSKEIMAANFPDRVLTAVAPEVLEGYQTGVPVKFKDGELVMADGDSKVFVISGGYRRWIKTQAGFEKLGYKWDNIIVTSAKAIAIHSLGEDID
ncbi:MAG: hypothetical protein RB292_01060 [Patescibacteria group bacterium]|jgi:hypothetical protein|nr:hypothetical protein [Patescibacteria group bacterium]